MTEEEQEASRTNAVGPGKRQPRAFSLGRILIALALFTLAFFLLFLFGLREARERFPDHADLMANGTAGQDAVRETGQDKERPKPVWVADDFWANVRFSHDSSKFVACGPNGFRIWDISKRRIISETKGSYVYESQFTPDNQYLVAVGDSVVLIWDIARQQVKNAMYDQKGRIDSLAVSPDGKWFATGSHRGSIWIWQMLTGKALRDPLKGCGLVYSLQVTTDGERILWGTHAGRLRSHNLTTGNQKHVAGNDHGYCCCVAVAPNGSTVATAGKHTNVKVWDLPGLELLKSVDGFGGEVPAHVVEPGVWISDLAWSPDGRYLACARSDCVISILDVSTGKAARALCLHADRVHSVDWSHDGRWIASVGLDGNLFLTHSGLHK